MDSKEYETAKTELLKLVELHPDNNNVKVALGQCHLERFKQIC